MPRGQENGDSLHDDDALLGGGVDVHVVHAGAGPPNDFQVISGIDDISCDLCRRSDDQAVVVLPSRDIF